MTGNAPGRPRILGTLRSDGGDGVVRMEDRFDTDIDDLWSALTDPARLSRWHSRVEGDLRLGGTFRRRRPDHSGGRAAGIAPAPASRLRRRRPAAPREPGRPRRWS
jgi:hypothetical protein